MAPVIWMPNGASFSDALVAGVKGGLIGGATAGLMYGVGSFGQSAFKWAGNNGFKQLAAYTAKSALHGCVSGLSNVAQGGDFGNGFWTGALSSPVNGVLMGLTNGINNNTLQTLARVAAGAAAGGTISEIGGGNFANGAVTGAYQMLFNDGQHEKKKVNPNDLDPSSLGHNIDGDYYTGPNNPKSYNGKNNYSLIPKNARDYISYKHDRNYDSVNAQGPMSVINDHSVSKYDLEFARDQYTIGVNQILNGQIWLGTKTLIIGTSIGTSGVLKTISETLQSDKNY